MAGIIDGEAIDFEKYLTDTEESAKVKPASAWVHEMIAARNAKRNNHNAMHLPWAKTHNDIELRPGELSIWAGINGHGKSLMLGQVMLGLMAQNRRTLIASFEMKPRVTIERLTRQSAGSEQWTDEFAIEWGEWSDGRLWLYNQRNMVSMDRIFALCRYARTELKIDHIVIDSLMKCVGKEDDYNGQKYFIDQLFCIAQDTGLHVHLVHHMRKVDDESKPGGKFGLKGSGSISDQADNIFIVWKNKKKIAEAALGKEVDDSMPDAMLICEKQRNGDKEPRYPLWFHDSSTQFIVGSRAPIYQYVANDLVSEAVAAS